MTVVKTICIYTLSWTDKAGECFGWQHDWIRPSTICINGEEGIQRRCQNKWRQEAKPKAEKVSLKQEKGTELIDHSYQETKAWFGHLFLLMSPLDKVKKYDDGQHLAIETERMVSMLFLTQITVYSFRYWARQRNYDKNHQIRPLTDRLK